MKINNFFHSAPAWVNNSLAAILTLLLTIDQISPQVLELFGIINCQFCISILQKSFAFIAIILSIFKILMRAEPNIIYSAAELDNESGRNNLPLFQNPPDVPKKRNKKNLES